MLKFIIRWWSGRRKAPSQLPIWDLPLWTAAKPCPEAIRHRDWMLRHGYLTNEERPSE